MINLSNISKSYGRVKALDVISLKLEKGKQYALTGNSGSGKSTLLYLLGGLETPSTGEISVDGKSYQRMSQGELAEFRNKNIGFVFQFHFLLPTLNGIDNILLPAQIGGHNSKKIKSECLELAQEMGVTHCLEKFPYELSGGEQQRINIIRAMSLKPSLLLCDEPTGNLDSDNSRKVMDILKALANRTQATMIIVTHDLKLASEFPNQIKLRDGKLSHSNDALSH
jgi:lipoprotein-releasing system ATP-binding protein